MKKVISLILAALMALGCLGGCAPADAGQADADTTTAATNQTQSSPEAAQPLDVIRADIAISEVMPDNRKLILGHELDWVELYNPEEAAVSLDGYYLTDDPEHLQMLSLGGMQIPAQGYLVVPLDGQLQLSETGETVYLTCQDETVATLSFAAPENGESFDASGVCQWPTPGYVNTQDGYAAYLQSQTLPELIINEAMASNDAYYAVGGQYYDWVEIKNNSNAPIDLQEYYLTDQYENTQRYVFPDVTLQPGEVYMVVCSGNTSLGERHAPFKISTGGDTLYLAKRGTFIDALSLPADLKHNESFGRSGSLPVYLQKPTPAAENTEGYLTGVPIPQASVEPGVYENTITVELTGEGKIYYTLDGTRPSTKSRVYSGPITIDGVTTIRTFCVSGDRKSQLTSYAYVVGEQHDLPIVTISIPSSSLYGETGVINRDNIEYNYEKEGVISLIEDGEVKFSVPFGFRLHGNDSRKGSKQNFQLRFRAEYGASKLEYKVFDNRDIDSFDSLLLKGGSEDWNKANMRDEVATAIVDGTTELYTQAMKPVVLYLGDKYWGVYYIRERFSDEYVASHMDVSPESVDILFSSAAYTQLGSGRDYQVMKNFVRSHSLKPTENYAYVAQQINVTSLMDWYICRSYIGDTDLANIRRCRSSEGDGLWHWMYFDLDWGFYNRGNSPVSGLINMSGGDSVLMQGLIENEAFQDAFIKRYAYLMQTVLNEDYINGIIDSIVEQIESEMPRDRARWGATVSGWERSVQTLRNYVDDDLRHGRIMNNIKEYFSLSNAEMEAYFGEMWTSRH